MREDMHSAWESFDNPWERLRVIAGVVTDKNPEADMYDLFNYIREDIFKGWRYDEESEFVQKVDLEILNELEYGHS